VVSTLTIVLTLVLLGGVHLTRRYERLRTGDPGLSDQVERQ
jgi:hypothetical protein